MRHAVLDRIILDGYDIEIVPIDSSKDLSMREIYCHQQLIVCNCKGAIRWLRLVRIGGSRHTGQAAPPQPNTYLGRFPCSGQVVSCFLDRRFHRNGIFKPDKYHEETVPSLFRVVNIYI